MAKAVLIYRDKTSWPDGAILEMTIGRLPATNHERPHQLKYSLYYGKDGERIIGYDNERGQGDHRHLRQKEEKYLFIDIETLVANFLTDVRKERGEM
jgi:hypothetical protein